MSEVTSADVNAEPEAKKGPNKLILIGGAVAVLLALAGGGAFFLMQSGGASAPEQAETVTVPEPYFFDLPDMVVNLNTSSETPSYLRLRVALELYDQAVLAAVEPRMPRVLDAFQVYLRELRPSDLEGSAGIHRLKEELMRRVNLAVYPAVVDNILFKEIIIQ